LRLHPIADTAYASKGATRIFNALGGKIAISGPRLGTWGRIGRYRVQIVVLGLPLSRVHEYHNYPSESQDEA